MAEYTQSRRTFLTVASTGVAAASVGIAGGCASGDAGEQSTGLNVSSIGEGDAVVTGDNSTVVVMRDSSGVYAMSLVCKHLGCTISSTAGTVSGSAIECQCHGSTYDGVGGNTGGPAQSPLDHLEVTIDEEGNVTVNADSVVDADTRAEVATA